MSRIKKSFKRGQGLTKEQIMSSLEITGNGSEVIRGNSSAPKIKRILVVSAILVGILILCGICVTTLFQTINPSVDFSPTWSPDGRQIAFISTRYGNQEIYVMNADGTELKRLTKTSLDEWAPDWSPDGKRIVFVYGPLAKEEQQIYLINSDGSNRSQVTPVSTDYTSPDWSPDGKQIAFESFQDKSQQIYVINIDGSNLTKLTNIPAWKGGPAWSPDGKLIAFDMYTDPGGPQVGFMNADGTGMKQLSYNSAFFNTDPDWSPDGAQIVFSSGNQGSIQHLYVINSDGTEQSLLPTPENLSAEEPVWSPDGKLIAFTCSDDGRFIARNICVINADGTNLKQLTK
jgi:Tol biopolymer transport system component